MVSREVKAQLDEILPLIHRDFPYINSYNDLIAFLSQFWRKHSEKI